MRANIPTDNRPARHQGGMFNRIPLTALAVLLLTACTKEPDMPALPVTPSQDARIALHLVADAGLNPGATGQAAPVRVRMYELKSAANFLRSDYFALAERTTQTLGADLLEQDEIWVHPGEQRQLGRDLSAGTRHVGLVVAYRDIDQAQWRALLTVAPGQTNKFLINLDAHGVRSDFGLSPAQ